MSEPFVGQIQIFPYNFAPRGWAFCQGQLLSISQNTALFSLLGTYYGGNGTSNFALPNLQGCGIVGQGQGPGLTDRVIGETSGTSSVTLLSTEMPQHTHTVSAYGGEAKSRDPGGNVWAMEAAMSAYYNIKTPDVTMNAGAMTTAGGSQPHNNMMPSLGITYCIALQGVYPARN